MRLQICDRDEFLQDILGEHVGESGLIDVDLRHVDVLGAHVQVRRGDCASAPVRVRAELLLLVGFLHGDGDFFAENIRSFDGGFRLMLCFLVLFFDFLDLFVFHRGRSHFLTEDDVSDFELRECCDVNVVLFRVVGKNEILEFVFDFHPFVIGKSRPNMIRLRDDLLVRFQDHTRFVDVHVKRAQNEDQTREGCVRRA